MSTEQEEKRGYGIIEFPIYEKLDWNMNLIIKCLEFLRNEISEKFNFFPKTMEFDLIAMTNFTGSSYPVIGMYSADDNDFKKVPDFTELDNLITDWIEDIGIENLKKKSENIEIIDWESLKEMKTYPKR